jgi:hypothetical protein
VHGPQAPEQADRDDTTSSRSSLPGPADLLQMVAAYAVIEDARSFGLPHPQGLRGQSASTGDRPHRPVPDVPRRPKHAVGGDLAGDGAACYCRQGGLPRQQQLRRGQIATAQGVAASRHFMGLVSEQSVYSLSACTIELEVIPALRPFGLGLIPYSPLGGGLLGGVLQKAGQGRRADDRMQQQIQQLRPQLEAYEELCRELGETPAGVALAWLLHQPAVTATIVGPRTADQLTRSLRPGDHFDRGDAARARRDLARPRRRGPRSLRLVRACSRRRQPSHQQD